MSCNILLATRERDALEQLIDKRGLADVLETIASICDAKVEHIETCYGDAALASLWNDCSWAVLRAAGHDRVRELFNTEGR